MQANGVPKLSHIFEEHPGEEPIAFYCAFGCLVVGLVLLLAGFWWTLDRTGLPYLTSQAASMADKTESF